MAADELCLTKGAVSYRIAQLEAELGFNLFDRIHRGITLTDKGERLWQAAQNAFDGLEREIDALRADSFRRVTVGLATYFASRWLSSRLMRFMEGHPEIGLRLQPLIDLIDLRGVEIDLAIRWGDGHWNDLEIEPLLSCPAFPTAAPAVRDRVERMGFASGFENTPLLIDRDGSTAWRDWHRAAGLTYHAGREGLVIPDPNVRVQAVIDGQGIALNDSLLAPELADGRLCRVTNVALQDYGYFLAYPPGALRKPEIKAFRDWIVAEAGTYSK